MLARRRLQATVASLLACAGLSLAPPAPGQNTFSWSGADAASGSIALTNNWHHPPAGAPAAGDHLHFAAATGSQQPSNTYGTAGWFGDLVALSGAPAITWSGDTTRALKVENRDSAALFTIASDLGNREGLDLELNTGGSGGLKVTGVVTLDAGRTLTVRGTGTLEIVPHPQTGGGRIDGASASMRVTDSPTIILGGENTFGGTLDIEGGTVELLNTADPLDAGGITLGAASGSAGATLQLGAGVTVDTAIAVNAGSTGTLCLKNGAGGTATVSGAVTLNRGFTATALSGSTLVFAGVISGAHGITLSHAGTVHLAAENTFTGGVTLNAGALRITADNNLGTPPAAPTPGHIALNGGTLYGHNASFTLHANRGIVLGDAGGTIQVYNGRTLTYSGTIAGSGPLTKEGAGTLALSGTSTFTNATTLAAGTVEIASDACLGAPPAAARPAHLTLRGGTLKVASGTVALAAERGLSLGAGGGTIEVGAGATCSYAGVAAGTGGLTKAGAGALTLSGANTFAGGLSVKAGTLTAGGNAGALSTNAVITLGDATGANAATLNFAGTGFQAANTAGLTVAAGSSGIKSIATSSGSAFVYAGPITLADDLTIAQNPGGGSLRLSGAIGGAGDLTVSGASVNLDADETFDGAIATTAALLRLGGANTFTGGVTIHEGTVRLESTTGLGAPTVATVTFGAGTTTGTLRLYDRSATVVGLNTDATPGTPVVENGSGTATRTLTVNNAAANTYAGVLQDGAVGVLALAKGGAGALTLAGTSANTHTGGTTVNAGTLQLNKTPGVNAVPGVLSIAAGTVKLLANHQIADAADVAIAAGAALDLNGRNDAVDALAGVAGAGVDTTGGGTATLTVGAGGGSGAFDGVLRNTVGTLALTKAGTGTQTLGGANTYGGYTTVSNGTLKLSGTTGDVIPHGSGKGNLVLSPAAADTATFDLNGRNETINGLFSAGEGTAIVDNTAGASAEPYELTVGDNDQTSAFGGSIQNSVNALRIRKIGAGTLTLGGNNTYSGGTHIGDNGQIDLGSATALGTGALRFTGSARIDNASGGPLAIANDVLLSGGSPTFVGSAPLSLAGTFTLMNANRSVTVGSGGTLSLQGAIVNDGTVRNLTKLGTGTLIVTGSSANTYGGLTSVESGVLGLAKTDGAQAIPGDLSIGDYIGTDTVRLLADNQIADTADLLVNATGLFDLNGNAEAIDALSGNGVIENTGAGAATLTVGSDDGTSVFGGAIRNGGGDLALTKTGTGTLTLSGACTSSGPTSVAGGTLLVNGSISGNGGTVTVAGTLGGTGVVGRAVNVDAGGVLAPGITGAGALTLTHGLTFAGGAFQCVATSTAADGYSQLVVTGGDVALGDGVATLSLDASACAAANGDMIWLIRNTGAGQTTGHFSGLPANSTVSAGDVTFFIVYDASYADKTPGGGKDVALVNAGVANGGLYEVE